MGMAHFFINASSKQILFGKEVGGENTIVRQIVRVVQLLCRIGSSKECTGKVLIVSGPLKEA